MQADFAAVESIQRLRDRHLRSRTSTFVWELLKGLRHDGRVYECESAVRHGQDIVNHAKRENLNKTEDVMGIQTRKSWGS